MCLPTLIAFTVNSCLLLHCLRALTPFCGYLTFVLLAVPFFSYRVHVHCQYPPSTGMSTVRLSCIGDNSVTSLQPPSDIGCPTYDRRSYSAGRRRRLNFVRTSYDVRLAVPSHAVAAFFRPPAHHCSGRSNRVFSNVAASFASLPLFQRHRKTEDRFF